MYLLLELGFTLDQLTSVFNNDSNFKTLVELAEHKGGDVEYNLLSLLRRAGISPELIINFINQGKDAEFFARLLRLYQPVEDENGLLIVADSMTVEAPLSILRKMGISDDQIIESISSPEGQRRLEVLLDMWIRRNYTCENQFIGNTPVVVNVFAILQQFGLSGRDLYSILAARNGEACLSQLLSEMVTLTPNRLINWADSDIFRPVLWIEYLLANGITVKNLVSMVQIPGAFELFIDLEQRRHYYLIEQSFRLQEFPESFDINPRPAYRDAVIPLLRHEHFRELMANLDIRNQFVLSCLQYLSVENSSATEKFEFLLRVLNDPFIAEQFRANPYHYANLLKQMETIGPEVYLELADQIWGQLNSAASSSKRTAEQTGLSSASVRFFSYPAAVSDENPSAESNSTLTSTGASS